MNTTWQIGSYIPRPGFRMPFYLSVQSDPDDFRLAVTSLAASNAGPFILLAPTEDFWRSEYYELLNAKKARFLALCDIVDWNGKLTAKQPINKILADLLEQILPSDVEETVFRREGDVWRVVYNGATVSLRHSTGLACIGQLLKNPNQDIHATFLQSAAAGIPLPSFGSVDKFHDTGDGEKYASRKDRRKGIAAGSHLDQEALMQYKARMEDIEEELKLAESNNDTGRIASLKREFNQLSSEVGRATGLGGRLRRNGDGERSRKAVSNAIHRAFTAIKKKHSSFEDHLRRSINIAEVLSYRPDKPTIWAT